MGVAEEQGKVSHRTVRRAVHHLEQGRAEQCDAAQCGVMWRHVMGYDWTVWRQMPCHAMS